MEQKRHRKIGHIVQRGASWYVPTYLGRRLVRDPTTGVERWKEQRRWVRFGSYREAREALSSLRGTAAKRTLAKITNEKVGEYLLRWLKNHERSIALKTAYDYALTINTHLIPTLGQIPLKNLEAEHIDDYVTKKLGAGLSPTTVRLHFTILRKALSTPYGSGGSRRIRATQWTGPNRTDPSCASSMRSKVGCCWRQPGGAGSLATT
jgi:hypothetical protein